MLDQTQVPTHSDASIALNRDKLVTHRMGGRTLNSLYINLTNHFFWKYYHILHQRMDLQKYNWTYKIYGRRGSAIFLGSYILHQYTLPYLADDITADTSTLLTFTPSNSLDAQCVNITIEDDEILEYTESFTVFLNTTDDYVKLEYDELTIYIEDNDCTITMSIGIVHFLY